MVSRIVGAVTKSESQHSELISDWLMGISIHIQASSAFTGEQRICLPQV